MVTKARKRNVKSADRHNNHLHKNISNNPVNNEVYYIIAIVALAAALFLTLVYFSSITLSYNPQNSNSKMLENSMAHPYIINPGIRYYVGAASPNNNGLINVLTNQIFCPESKSVRTKFAANFNYPYYVNLSKNQVFNYSFIYNGSKSRFISAMIGKSFHLISSSVKINNYTACLGYPNSRYNVTLRIKAPNSPTASKIYGVLYFNTTAVH